MAKKEKIKITVEAFATSGKIKNRRGHNASASYVYRLIRQHAKGERSTLPFRYIMEGEKDRVWIIE